MNDENAKAASADFNEITLDDTGEFYTNAFPADETVVEVRLDDGTVHLAWFACNIMEPGDHDWLPIDAAGEPDMEAESILNRVFAWRALT